MAHSLTAMMYVPGIDESKLNKINDLIPNAYILDLEDAVAIDVKSDARTKVERYLSNYDGQQELWVRVNSIDSGFMFDDLNAVVSKSLTGIVVPKVEESRTIHAVEWLLDELERGRGLEPRSIKIMPLIESAKGIANLEETVRSSRRTICLGFGAGDYSLDVGVEWPQPDGTISPIVLSAKMKLVEVSAIFGLLAPHDGVFPGVRDMVTLANEAQSAYRLGFGGKHAIHPGQIEVIRESFAPSALQISWAEKVLQAFKESEAHGIAAIELDGKFIDYPVVQRARQVLSARIDKNI